MSNETKIVDIIRDKLIEENISYERENTTNPLIDKSLEGASKTDKKGKGHPDFICNINNEFLLIIECKADINNHVKYSKDKELKMDIKTVRDYAVNGAIHYAQHIIKKSPFKKIFAFGCSGDKKHYKITPYYINEEGYIVLKDINNFINFNADNINKYYHEQVLKETPSEVLELEDLMKKAEELHEYLRTYAGLRETEKPIIVSAILLALEKEKDIINRLNGDENTTDGIILYRAIKDYLKEIDLSSEIKENVLLNSFNLIYTKKVLNQKNKKLQITPLKFFTNYIKDNIYERIKSNNQIDLLGKFYGEFVKYGGGDGQKLGIVLTPSHITDLFCELVDLNSDDIVFDPCCGTGSFLVSSMNHMFNKCNSYKKKQDVKENQLWGVERDEDMFSIATTNMILRGDGKSNLIRDDFFNLSSEELKDKGFTVGFMNPPYSQANNKDTYESSEINFIEHLLDSLNKKARCAVIVPTSTMTGKNKNDRIIKEQILLNHTLEGVITLNKDTFGNKGTHTCIAIFTASTPHKPDKRVKFINYMDDGYELLKHKGLIKTSRALERRDYLLKCWRDEEDAGTDFMIKTTVKPSDEWLHSFYYFNDTVPSDEDFEKVMGDYLSFEFNMVMQGREYLFNMDD